MNLIDCYIKENKSRIAVINKELQYKAMLFDVNSLSSRIMNMPSEQYENEKSTILLKHNAFMKIMKDLFLIADMTFEVMKLNIIKK